MVSKLQEMGKQSVSCFVRVTVRLFSVLVWVLSRQWCLAVAHCGVGCIWCPRTSTGSHVGEDLGGILYPHIHGYLHIGECCICVFPPCPCGGHSPALWLRQLLEKCPLHLLPFHRRDGGVPHLPPSSEWMTMFFVSGHLHVKGNEEKMSKSLKNYITIKVTRFP